MSHMKMHITYGGLMSLTNNKFSYSGGMLAMDYRIDPDLMTWSIFQEFTEKQGVESGVEQVWYRLPNEDISVARCIYKDKDNEIRKMCSEVAGVGEVYVYIEHSVSPPVIANVADIEADDDGGEKAENEEYFDEGEDADNEEEEEEEEEEEVEDGELEPEKNDDADDENRYESEAGNENVAEEAANEGDGQPSEDEAHILGEGAVDPRFENFFANAEEETHTGYGTVLQNVDNDEASDSDIEDDIDVGEYPDSPVDTDEEWANFHKKDDRRRRRKGKSVADYDKPPYLWLMQTFNNGDEFKDQLLRYVLKTQYDVKLNRWESTKHAAVCTEPKCQWRIYCSVEKPLRKWMVKVYVDKHNHVPTGRARMLKQGTIAKLFKEEARRRPDIRSTDIKDELMNQYNVSVSIYKCRKARRIALDMVLETQKEQFAKLWDYEAELLRADENTTTEIVTVEKDGKNVFDRFYVCFEQLRRTWKKSCRPLIGLDGAFLKWELKGEILSAVGRDAENRIYPIAWAVVRGEDKDSWEWFVRKLKVDLNLELGDGYSFHSDKQKGLQIALATVLPNAEHRVCARHVYGNWKKRFGDLEYKPFFWNVAYSYTQAEYKLHMEELRLYDREAYEALLDQEPEHWCRAFFSKTGRSANVCNNLSESFNRTIKKARELPLINMLESIRRQAMMRIARRLKRANNCIMQFPQRIADVLEENRKNSKDCMIITSSDNLYEVLLYGCGHEVSLRLRTCVCKRWDITGIPCTHAICVINDIRRKPEDYVDKFYRTHVWIDNYKDNIKPVNGELYWEKTGKEPIGVPGFRKMPGRPKKKRIKAAHESPSKPNKTTRHGRTVTCSNCKQVGHNCSTCKNQSYAAEGPKRKRGRPRKIPVDSESNPNPPKRQRKTQSQSSIPAPATITSASAATSPFPPASSAPEASATGRRRGRPPGRGRGRPPVRRQPSIPRGIGLYICPFTDRVFDVRGNRARDLGSGQAYNTSQGPRQL